MFKKTIDYPWLNRRNIEPKIYSVRCSKCDYLEDFELSNCDVDIAINDEAHNILPKIVNSIPTNCPKCQAKLKKTKIPVKICY